MDKVGDCSTIYADLTYGTKPTPMVISLAMLCIELIHKYSDVAQLVYGRIYWKTEIDNMGKSKTVIDYARIYDVTEVLRIITLAQKMESVGGENIEGALFELLGI